MRFLSKIILVGVVASALVLSVVTSARAADPTARIAPIHTSPGGQTYGRWAAAWLQWLYGIPAAVNPGLDTTGKNCAQRQVGEVWFLSGSLIGPVVRTCAVPAGKSLFFPLINYGYGAFLNDLPPETRTEEYVRAAGSCTVPAEISVQIDGFNVPQPTRFFTGASGSQSPIFTLQLPPGNLFGGVPTPTTTEGETWIPELVLTPSAEQGYYLFVFPLDAGEHTIRWMATGCQPWLYQDVTYHLIVE